MYKRETHPRLQRSQRLIRLTALFCEQRTLGMAEVKERFRITRRTAMRDLYLLREAGLHIVFFPYEQQYRLIDIESC